MSIIIFIIILAILILVHEFGHFIVAKKFGIRVDEFGLGFPPKLIAKKWGETLYTLNAIPFGGFVKIFGEDSHREDIPENERSQSFSYKPKWVKASVLIAGVTFNIIFAWLVLSSGYLIGMPSSASNNTLGKVSDTHLIITEVLPDSPADKAGLKPGDEISRVYSGQAILNKAELSPENVQKLINESSEKTIGLDYVRGKSAEIHIQIEPQSNLVAGKKIIGIAMDSIGVLKLPIHLALFEGARTTWLLTKATASGLLTFLWNTIRFKADFSQVAGPIGIASVVKDATNLGFIYLLSFISIISINLAIINLLPLPALDGGRLFFLIIESVIRRPIKPRTVQLANTIGFVFLVILMVLVTGHDILKLL
ncbi:RIP metalloprotease RseP [Patescibacteria group bacterium]|nr:RIP metalloprotease RseP [Patescibacteria group bacterium]